ncbi:NAD-dependent epimerase/dehydratase family protein [Gordonia sp. NPDC003429]
MSRVLVTGAAGFIGSRVAATLADRGHDVVGIDAMLPSAHPAAADPPPGVAMVDVTDAAALDTVLPGVDVVNHQAALVGLGLGFHDAPEFARNNDLGTATLLAAMHRHGVRRLVVASSMVLYGNGCHVDASGSPLVDVPERRPADLRAGRFEHVGPDGCDTRWAPTPEHTPPAPQNHYAASKAAQEQYARGWAVSTGSHTIALRYHNVYGPHMPRDTPYAGVASIFRSMLAAGRAPLVFEDGAQMRDFVHVDDVAMANALAVEALVDEDCGPPRASFDAFNVASGVPVSIGTLATILSDELGGPSPIITHDFRLGDVRHVVADPTRAAQVLGFRAQITPDRGFRAFAHEPLRGDSLHPNDRVTMSSQ